MTDNGALLRRKKIKRVADEWLALGLSTKKINRRRVRGIVGRLYRAFDEAPPKKTIVLDSPASCLLAIAQIRDSTHDKDGLKATLTISLRGPHRDQLPDVILRRLVHRFYFLHLSRRLWEIEDVQLRALGLRRGQGLTEALRNHFNKRVKPKLELQLEFSIGKADGNARLVPDRRLPVRANLGAHDTGLFRLDLALRFGNVANSRQANRDKALLEYARNCGWGYFFRDYAFVSDRPEILRFREDAYGGRLHCDDGPAIQYRDGFRIYANEGRSVPGWTIEEPEKITVDHVLQAADFEMRRFLLERMTAEKFIRQGGAQAVAEDRFGVLWKRMLAPDDLWSAVEVVNGTPEKDGSYRHFFLQVPPEIKTARGAVAWTYGLTAEDYSPQLRT